MSVRRASGLALDNIMVRFSARFLQAQLLRECASVVHERFYVLAAVSVRVRGVESRVPSSVAGCLILGC